MGSSAQHQPGEKGTAVSMGETQGMGLAKGFQGKHEQPC